MKKIRAVKTGIAALAAVGVLAVSAFAGTGNAVNEFTPEMEKTDVKIAADYAVKLFSEAPVLPTEEEIFKVNESVGSKMHYEDAPKEPDHLDITPLVERKSADVPAETEAPAEPETLLPETAAPIEPESLIPENLGGEDEPEDEPKPEETQPEEDAPEEEPDLVDEALIPEDDLDDVPPEPEEEPVDARPPRAYIDLYSLDPNVGTGTIDVAYMQYSFLTPKAIPQPEPEAEPEKTEAETELQLEEPDFEPASFDEGEQGKDADKEAKSEDKSEDKSEAKAEDKSEDKSDDKAEDKSEDASDKDSGDEDSEKSAAEEEEEDEDEPNTIKAEKIEPAEGAEDAPAEEQPICGWLIPSAHTGEEIFTARFDGEVQQCDAYTLVCMICATEMSPSFSQEALKAQAIAAYSYLKYHNVNGLTPSVLVKHRVHEATIAAVDAVFGQCVYYNDQVAQTVYTASSAGTTASAVNVWGGDVPYLVSVETPIDELYDPNWGIEVEFTAGEMKTLIEKYCGITLSDTPENWIRIDSYHDGRYVDDMTIDGQVTIKGQRFREGLMHYALKSWAFDVSYDAESGIFKFTTYGYGHGVGLSQNGANILGRQGYTYDQILATYFPNTVIK